MSEDKNKPRRRLRKVLVILGSVLLALFTVLALAEVGLRVAARVALEARDNPGEVSGAKTILCVGDSWTYGDGSGDPAKHSYPAQLRGLVDNQLGKGRYRVINEGRPGATTGEVLDWTPALVKKHRPEVVLLLSGGTTFVDRWNAYRGISADSFGALGKLKIFQVGQLALRPQVYRQNKDASAFSRKLVETVNGMLTAAEAAREDSKGQTPCGR